nr:MAG TPA: hypothetical protein [Bacteriophage sp.]
MIFNTIELQTRMNERYTGIGRSCCHLKRYSVL